MPNTCANMQISSVHCFCTYNKKIKGLDTGIQGCRFFPDRVVGLGFGKSYSYEFGKIRNLSESDMMDLRKCRILINTNSRSTIMGGTYVIIEGN